LLQLSQWNQIIKAAKSKRDKALFAVIGTCGLLRSEVAFLVRGDWVDGRLTATYLDGKRLEFSSITTTGRLLDEYLAERSDAYPAMFLSRKGGAPLGGHGVFVAFQKAAQAAGMPAEFQHPRCLLGIHRPWSGGTHSWTAPSPQCKTKKKVKFAIKAEGFGISREFDSLGDCLYALTRVFQKTSTEVLVRCGEGQWLSLPLVLGMPANAVQARPGAKSEDDKPGTAPAPETPSQAVL
jgi:hypothetical protein